MTRRIPKRASALSVVLLSGLFGLTGPTMAQAQTQTQTQAQAWELDREASRIALIATAEGREAMTRVEGFDIDLEGELDRPAEAELTLTLRSESITGGNDIVDGMLHGRHWFDVEAYPEIVFRSTEIQAPAEGEWRVEGELELRGDTYPLTMPVRWTRQGERVRVTGRLALDRTDFDMGRGAWRSDGTVKHEVYVDFALELLTPSGS